MPRKLPKEIARRESIRERTNRKYRKGKKSTDAELQAVKKAYQQNFFRDM